MTVSPSLEDSLAVDIPIFQDLVVQKANLLGDEATKENLQEND